MNDQNTNTTIDLSTVRTPSGKTIKDFEIPEKMITGDPALVELVMRSESMNDKERQYWFNLAKVMNESQVEKLRGILTREREKLAEIEQRYSTNSSKESKISPEEVAVRNAQMEADRRAKQEELRQREEAAEKEEDDEAILADLDNL